MKRLVAFMGIAGLALSIGAYLSPGSAQKYETRTFLGHKIFIPESSVPHPGRINTNYFWVDSTERTPGPPPGAETPGSVACVYKLVSGPAGCPIATSTNVPTGGHGAIAIVDAGHYPTAAADLHAFSAQFGLPDADFQIVYADGTQPPVYPDWEVEEALDIEWAHAMAPQAKLFLVESTEVNTDPTWRAVAVAGKLVHDNGGGTVSNSWGIPEWPQEVNFDKYFTYPGAVYFAASGDFGLNQSFHPAASPDVVSVGGTFFNRDQSGKFVSEQYYTGGGGGDISPYEPRPAYQDGIANIVGTHRGFPDVGSDYCCAAIYLEGGWGEVGGTSWSSPTFAGIVNAAGLNQKSSNAELHIMYRVYANQKAYKATYNDITTGDSHCKTGWDICAGIGSPKGYKGK